MKIKAIIVDDELLARELVRNLCYKLYSDKIEIADECPTVAKAVQSVLKYSPDLIFLDIQMRGESGFDLLEHFPQPKFDVIFTTAHKDFAIRAIRSSAIDYLLKPIQETELKLAIERYEALKVNTLGFDRFRLLIENINNQFTDKQRIALPKKNGLEVIQANSVTHCKSDGAYTFVYTIDDCHHISKSLKEVEAILSLPVFLRVHKSHIVNCNYVKSFSAEGTLQLITGALIPVSEQFSKKALIDALTK